MGCGDDLGGGRHQRSRRRNLWRDQRSERSSGLRRGHLGCGGLRCDSGLWLSGGRRRPARLTRRIAAVDER